MQPPRKPPIFFSTTILALVALTLHAEDVTLDWVATGFMPKAGYYKPLRVQLSSEKSAGVSKISAGIVNRRYTKENGHADDPRDQRLHVSTDWAQGSSGAAVLDVCGNVVGHVARIQTLLGEKHGDAAPSVMSLHEAVPASCVRQLIRGMQKSK